jgi:hypothetical protein
VDTSSGADLVSARSTERTLRRQRDGNANGTEGETRMEVRQAAKIVATTCVVTFAVVLTALLMVR